MSPIRASLVVALVITAGPVAAQPPAAPTPPLSVIATGPGSPPYGPRVDAILMRVRANEPAAMRELLALAEAGDAAAQTAVAPALLVGAGLPRDPAKACALVAKAAASRIDALHLSGECLQFGYGGPKDPEKAMAAFRKAGDAGLAKSRCAEGNLLIELGREQTHAVDLCRQGAQMGDRDAQTDIGNFFLTGQYVPRDPAAARFWYEQAVEQGQPDAAVALGQVLWNGDGVRKDVDRAAQLWRFGYENGREDAALYLGDAALLKASVGPSQWDAARLAAAREWYSRATKSRNAAIARKAEEGRARCDAILAGMQPAGAPTAPKP